MLDSLLGWMAYLLLAFLTGVARTNASATAPRGYSQPPVHQE